MIIKHLKPVLIVKETRHSWGASYKGIRQASIFIQNIDMNTKFTEEERADMKAQARFVRAYYYWLLLRRYGPVPILPDEGLNYTASYDRLELDQRNTYDECVEYIESEMRLGSQRFTSESELLIKLPVPLEEPR